VCVCMLVRVEFEHSLRGVSNIAAQWPGWLA